jgi:transposase-like protein
MSMESRKKVIKQQIEIINEYAMTGNKNGYRCPNCRQSQISVTMTSHGRGVWFTCTNCQYTFHVDRD